MPDSLLKDDPTMPQCTGDFKVKKREIILAKNLTHSESSWRSAAAAALL
jgi:hypothetical protein